MENQTTQPENTVDEETESLTQDRVDRPALVTQLLDIGTSLSSTSDLDTLLELILQKSREITCSDAGSVYLIDRSKGRSTLIFKVAQNASRPDVSWEEFVLPTSQKSLAGHVAETGEILNIPDAYALPQDAPYKHYTDFDRFLPYHTRSVLVLPMQNYHGKRIGVLQLINRKISPEIVITKENVEAVTLPFEPWQERVLKSLASQAAISIERSQLQESVARLFASRRSFADTLEPTQQTSQESDRLAKLVAQLLDIGASLSSTHNLEDILKLILTKSREITSSDAGSVYLVDRSQSPPWLIFKVAQNASRPDLSWTEFAMPITQKSLAGYVADTGESLNLPDAYNPPPGAPYQINPEFDRNMPYHTRSVMVLPMQNQEGEIIGVLQLINRKISPEVLVTPDNVMQVTLPYTKGEEEIIKSLASQAAISIERSQLQENIENLFKGFVQASVEVIESRDPTTSGHSERVEQLTVRLAEEVSTISHGALRDIYFDQRQITEISYAALLHDFGKVGVPEAVLVKAKKLYPHEMEGLSQRFSLVRRSLEFECAQTKFQYLLGHSNHIHDDLNQTCTICSKLTELDAQLAENLAQLEQYWRLVQAVNEPQILASYGFQVLTEEALADLTALSQYTYQDVDGTLKPLLTPSELEKLLVPRGSLTTSERAAIEQHAENTYNFLIQIPWTKHLKNVPEIARGHHKKLDGSGYPYDLHLPNIPIQTQMLTIADIYDALTASDRPYKKRLSVEAAIGILQEEVHKNKLNGDLLLLFEQRQVFRVLGHAFEEH